MAYLYYDGELEASASFSGDFDWGGNNKAGIGGENDNVGGYTNSEQTEHFGRNMIQHLGGTYFYESKQDFVDALESS